MGLMKYRFEFTNKFAKQVQKLNTNVAQQIKLNLIHNYVSGSKLNLIQDFLQV